MGWNYASFFAALFILTLVVGYVVWRDNPAPQEPCKIELFVNPETKEIITPMPKEPDMESMPFPSPAYDELTVEATAYTNCDAGMDCKGITYSGLATARGTIAVDPDVIPLGSILWVEGYGYGIALDTGSAIKGNKIDVFFHEVADAMEWGRKEVKVRVY